jgi:peptidoglycan/xylan/chitin deacetylase (PgdA/CDA1 family)
MITVTTSWDDGDALDLRLAELLSKYGIKGTFYISREESRKLLSEDELRTIAAMGHEIGAHTLSHPDLTKIPFEQKCEEMAGSKKWLEGVLGAEVLMFCYPFGRFDAESKRAVREAGFKGARTTVAGSVAVPADPFEMNTTLQVYPFPFRKKDARSFSWRYLLQPWYQRGGEFRSLGVSLLAMRSWKSVAQAALANVPEGGTFHVWGHSWEIEKYGMWGEFEEFLQFLAVRSDCRFVTNGELQI